MISTLKPNLCMNLKTKISRVARFRNIFLSFIISLLVVTAVDTYACFPPGGWPVIPGVTPGICGSSVCETTVLANTVTSPMLEVDDIAPAWRLFGDDNPKSYDFNGSWSESDYFEIPINNSDEPCPYGISAGEYNINYSEYLYHTGTNVGVNLTVAAGVGEYAVGKVSLTATSVENQWHHYVTSNVIAENCTIYFSTQPGEQGYVDWMFKYTYHEHKRQCVRMYTATLWTVDYVHESCIYPIIDTYTCWDDLMESQVKASRAFNIVPNQPGYDFDLFPFCASPVIFAGPEPECPDD